MHSLRHMFAGRSTLVNQSATSPSASSAAVQPASSSLQSDVTPRAPKKPPRASRRAQIVIPASITAAVLVNLAVQHRSSTTAFITVVTPSGAKLQVEVARTPESRARGLAERDAPSGDGLLLEWPDAGPHPVWMAGMRFALDLVWLDDQHHVVAVLENVPPCEVQPCPLLFPPGDPRSLAVLELPAGGASRLGITVGSALVSSQPSP